MATPRLPGWDYAIGPYATMGKHSDDIAFDSMNVTNRPNNHITIEYNIRLTSGKLTYPDNDPNIVTKEGGTFFTYTIPFHAKNTLIFTFLQNPMRLVWVYVRYKHDNIFGDVLPTSYIRLQLAKLKGDFDIDRDFVHYIEGLYIDYTLDPSNPGPPSSWKDVKRPMLASIGAMYFPPIWDWYEREEGEFVGVMERTPGHLFVEDDHNQHEWLFPENYTKLREGMKYTYRGVDMGLYRRVAPLKFQPGKTTIWSFPPDSKFLGKWTTEDGDELTIEDAQFNNGYFGHAFILTGNQDFWYGYIGAQHIVMIYYPLLIVHYNAHCYDAKNKSLDEGKYTYLAPGHSWAAWPSESKGGGGGGSSGIFPAAVGLLALMFLVK